MTRQWWKTGRFVVMGVALLTSIAGAQPLIGSDDLPFTISWYGRADYQFPGDTVAFNGITESDPYGVDIIIKFAYYVQGPMTLWTSKDGVTWTWHGDSYWMLEAAEPYTTARLNGTSWDPDDWAKYVRIDNYTYYNATYGGAIVLTGVEPLFPGRDPRLPANQPPVAGNIAVSTDTGCAVAIDVSTAAYDPDGDALTVTAGAASHGAVAVNPDNTLTYTPNAGFAGIDTFSYTVDDGKGGTATGTVSVTVNAKSVAIDIKPGSYPNSINLGSNGVVPVAILSAADFDALTVDPATVSLAGAGVAVRGKANRYMASNQDVNADGRLDLVLQVETENLDPSQLQDGHGTIVGTTYAGVAIIGIDDITIVPSN